MGIHPVEDVQVLMLRAKMREERDCRHDPALKIRGEYYIMTKDNAIDLLDQLKKLVRKIQKERRDGDAEG